MPRLKEHKCLLFLRLATLGECGPQEELSSYVLVGAAVAFSKRNFKMDVEFSRCAVIN